MDPSAQGPARNPDLLPTLERAAVSNCPSAMWATPPSSPGSGLCRVTGLMALREKPYQAGWSSAWRQHCRGGQDSALGSCQEIQLLQSGSVSTGCRDLWSILSRDLASLECSEPSCRQGSRHQLPMPLRMGLMGLLLIIRVAAECRGPSCIARHCTDA